MFTSGCLQRLELLGVFCWLVKDLGCVLLFPTVAFPAALAAICLETCTVAAVWGVEPTAELVHRVAVFFWLTGNTMWMVGELVFEASTEPGRQFPWFHGPLLGVRPILSTSPLQFAQGIFALGFAVLLVLYAWGAAALWRGSQGLPHQAEPESRPGVPADSQAAATGPARGIRQQLLVGGMVSERVYRWIFIGPWLAKDFFWTCEWLTCALVSGFAVVVVIIDCIRRFGEVVFVAELGWVVSNIIWIYSELGLNEAVRWPRVLAAAVLIADCLLIAVAINHAYKRSGSSSPLEYSPLVGSTGRSLHD
mmetsp:Transcript_124578/g.346910  ORF Transcript_124578/g.346910 Transcript_124578/m.346910 type:complete len:307 (-) Transcript_124578:86-1006(-)